METGELAKKILDTLPFDGSKAKLGGWGTAAGVAALLSGTNLPVDPVTLITTSLITFIVGRIHKWLKKKYPNFINLRDPML